MRLFPLGRMWLGAAAHLEHQLPLVAQVCVQSLDQLLNR